MELSNHTLLIVFVALTGVSVLLQAIVLVAILVSVRAAATKVLTATDDLKATIIPLVRSTEEIVERIKPQLITITQGLSDLTDTMHKQSASVRFSAAEIMERISHQTKRLDAMLSTGLDAVERTGTILETAVALPVRQFNGIFAAAKAMIETYRAVTPNHHKPKYVESIEVNDPDRDMVV